jgi:ribulose 1,5-bisphosphate synthetase/thiazole synthase
MLPVFLDCSFLIVTVPTEVVIDATGHGMALVEVNSYFTTN